MHPIRFSALTALVLAGSAEAQGTSGGCAGLAPDSFEASVLGCDGAAVRATPPRVVDILGEAPPPGAPLPAAGLDRAKGDGSTLAQASEGDARLRVVQGPEEASVLAGAVTAVAAEAGSEAVQVPGIPLGQRPPPGLCRIWFPSRHAGLQRPPTACDVEVPEGAVLIRG